MYNQVQVQIGMQSFTEYLIESKIKAEDFEAAIVVGWHNITDQPFDLSKSGISEKVYVNISSMPKVIEAGERIAQSIKDHFGMSGKEKAEQYGRAKTGLTSFWKSHGASDTTPKTDILIGDKRLSLKIGNAQLMSGGKAESTATFYAAMEKSQINESAQVQNVLGIMEDFVTASLAPSQLRPLIKSGENAVVNKGEKAHKEIMQELGKLFEENKQFKIEFAREAMSGFMKYGNSSTAAAEFMVVSNHSGTSTKIKSVYDDAYCEKIADKMRLQARFKTSSRKVKGQKTGEYNFWSVVSLIVNAMDEEVEIQGDSLNENIVTKVFRKLKGKLVGALQRAKVYVKRASKNLLRFFGAEPDIKVKKDIDFS